MDNPGFFLFGRVAPSAGLSSDRTACRLLAYSAWGLTGRSSTVTRVLSTDHKPFLIWTLSSVTWSYTCRRSFMSAEIFSTA